MGIQTSKLTVFCDIDGVVADFVGGACKAHGRPNPFTHPGTSRTSTGVFELIDIWGITKEQFWKPIDALGAGFWKRLERTEEASEIFTLAKSLGSNLAFLTAPSDDPGCVPGKRSWVEKNYPGTPVIFASAKAKQLLAHPGALLIDDKDSNCEEFYKAGGNVILVPRPWNKLAGFNTIDYVRTEIAKMHAMLEGPQRLVPGTTIRSKTKGGVSYTVSVDANSSIAAWKAARGDVRRVAGDDVCLLSCAFCGQVFNSGYVHQCPPPGSEVHAGPRC